MQIVIDIPKHIYVATINAHRVIEADSEYVAIAIKQGVVLPEHGRLIDADELKSHKYHDKKACENAVAVYYIDNAPTILPSSDTKYSVDDKGNIWVSDWIDKTVENMADPHLKVQSKLSAEEIKEVGE